MLIAFWQVPVKGLERKKIIPLFYIKIFRTDIGNVAFQIAMRSPITTVIVK
jgi:hypothetical protein